MAVIIGRSYIFVILAATFISSGAAAEKPRDWQTGKVLDSERSRYFAGTVGNANTNGQVQANGNFGTYQGNTSSSQRAIYRTYETFLIEGLTHAYLAQERLRWKWSKAANLTVNGPVKICHREAKTVRHR
jgi:hypothetical protein